jgi:hypothetical protein
MNLDGLEGIVEDMRVTWVLSRRQEGHGEQHRIGQGVTQTLLPWVAV